MIIDKSMLFLFRNALEVYEYFCRPVCKKYSLPQTALDILMFIASNPDIQTSKEISRLRGIKTSMVSFHVDRLVNEGYLERCPVPEDRRQVRLSCTEKAKAVVEEGQNRQRRFLERLSEGATEADRENLAHIQSLLKENIMSCKKMAAKGLEID